jgi:hypothetical protein
MLALQKQISTQDMPTHLNDSLPTDAISSPLINHQVDASLTITDRQPFAEPAHALEDPLEWQTALQTGNRWICATLLVRFTTSTFFLFVFVPRGTRLAVWLSVLRLSRVTALVPLSSTGRALRIDEANGQLRYAEVDPTLLTLTSDVDMRPNGFTESSSAGLTEDTRHVPSMCSCVLARPSAVHDRMRGLCDCERVKVGLH